MKVVTYNISYWMVHFLLKTIFKKNFYLFTPNASLPLSQILASSRLCKHVFALEEGLGSLKHLVIEHIAALPIKWNPFSFSHGIIPQHQNKYKGLIKVNATHEMSQSLQFMRCKSPFEIGDVLWVFDAAVEFKLITAEVLLTAVQNALGAKSDAKRIFVQFHPQQDNILKANIKAILPDNYQEINLPLETLIYPPNFQVFGFYSSLLYYLGKKGCQSTSLIPPHLLEKYIHVLMTQANVRFLAAEEISNPEDS